MPPATRVVEMVMGVKASLAFFMMMKLEPQTRTMNIKPR